MNNKILFILILILCLTSIANMIDKITDVLIQNQTITIDNPKIRSVENI